MRQERATPDQIIAWIARRQHGVISFEQLIEAGLSPSGGRHRRRGIAIHRTRSLPQTATTLRAGIAVTTTEH